MKKSKSGYSRMRVWSTNSGRLPCKTSSALLRVFLCSSMQTSSSASRSGVKGGPAKRDVYRRPLTPRKARQNCHRTKRTPGIPLRVSTKARLLRILGAATSTNHVFDLQQLTMILSPRSLSLTTREAGRSINKAIGFRLPQELPGRLWRPTTASTFQGKIRAGTNRAVHFHLNGAIARMKIVTIIARILLGLMFFVFGLNPFLKFLPMPRLEGV